MLEALSALNAVQITESDTTVYDPPLKALLILPDATGGNVVIKNEKDETITIPIDTTVTAAVFLPGRVRQVLEATTMDDEYIIGIR